MLAALVDLLVASQIRPLEALVDMAVFHVHVFLVPLVARVLCLTSSLFLLVWLCELAECPWPRGAFFGARIAGGVKHGSPVPDRRGSEDFGQSLPAVP